MTTSPFNFHFSQLNWRLIGWSAAAVLLLAPAVAMQFTNEVNWGPGDFVLAALLLAAVGGGLELVFRFFKNNTQRMLAGTVAVALLLVTWAHLAVGLFGD